MVRQALREGGSRSLWISHFPVAVIKHPDRSRVGKGGSFNLPQSSRVQPMRVEKSWQQGLRQLVALWCSADFLSIGQSSASHTWGESSYLD